MGKLKVPSLQHLVRVWNPDPQRIKKSLVSLARNSPTFSYEPVFDLVTDLVWLKVPYDQIVQAVVSRTKRSDVRDNYLSLLPLIKEHFEEKQISFFHRVAKRFYPVGRNLSIPFSPPFVYGSAAKVHLPWFSFWRSNPLSDERLSLFMSVVDEIIGQDPDLEDVHFSFLDFSASEPRMPRQLKILEGPDIPRVSAKSKIEMLSVFAEGFRLAEIELENISVGAETEERPEDDDQLPLF